MEIPYVGAFPVGTSLDLRLFGNGLMKKMLTISLCVCLFCSVASATTVRGIDIEFVTIGNPGNPGDTRINHPNGANPYGCGSVDYVYQIGTYEITASQWATIDAAAHINSSWSWSGDQPVAGISWYDAARFCNYLTTGNTESGVYIFASGSLTNIVDHQTAGATYGRAYFLPTEDEWYKAAYYTGSGYSLYANGTDTAPIAGTDTNYDRHYSVIGQPWDVGDGTQEQNGTFDMMGNVSEWNERVFSSYRGFRGGSFEYDNDGILEASARYNMYPYSEYYERGFRVASVPEPCSLVLLGLGGLLLRRKCRR